MEDQTNQPVDCDEEPDEVQDSRVEAILCLIQTGDGYKLDELLNQWRDNGWDITTCRDRRGLSLYTTAIEEGFLDIVNTLLKHDIPLGDALIRCVEENFEEAIRAICCYLSTHRDICKIVINATSDNDDFHPAITAIILAAQRNKFDVVKMLVGLGATINEPRTTSGANVTLTQAISTLHIYRALSQPAYMMSCTELDVFAYAFKMSKKLRELSGAWEDFGAEFNSMADKVDEFAAELLGQSSSTEEVLALFRYHKTDKYRNAEGKQHSLSKVTEAIMYQQKNFIAHPHTQKVLIAQFYRNLQSWNAKNALNRLFLALFIIVFYPLICLTYIVCPVKPVVRFVRIPYVMMLLKLGSSLTFVGVIVALGAVRRATNPELSEALRLTIFVWNIGNFWLHIKMIWKQGGKKFLHSSINIQEAVVVTLYLTIFCLQWDWNISIAPYIYVNRRRRTVENSTFLDMNETSDLQQHVSSALDGLEHSLTTSVREQVDSILMRTLLNMSCRHRLTPTEAPATNTAWLPEHYRKQLSWDAYDPILVSEALYGIAMVVSIMRLTNLLMVSESLGPLRISIGGMGGDFVKFLTVFSIVWVAFAVGMTQNYSSAGKSERLACLSQGGDENSCSSVVTYTVFVDTLQKLYWALFGLTSTKTLELSSRNYLAEQVGAFLFASYLVVGVIILLNALIGMLSSTYNIVEEHADTEWKFHRSMVWDTYLHPVGTLPPPFNLIPSLKSLWRLLLYIVGFWIKSARTVHKNKKSIHAKNELADYTRVISLINSRYIQGNLSPESQSAEGVSHQDLRKLKNDVLSLRFFTQNRLKTVTKSLQDTGHGCGSIDQKLHDLVPLDNRADGLNTHSVELTNQSDELKETIDNLNGEIVRLKKLLERTPEPEPEPDLPHSGLIRRIATIVEKGSSWGDNDDLRREMAEVTNRAGRSSVSRQMPRE